MDDRLLRVQTLIEALPYIQRFHGKIIVVKYGGAAMVDEALKAAVLEDLVLLRFVGIRPVLVHGGGPEVSDLMRRLGLEPRFVGGLRVTDAATMEVAEMVLGGKINKALVDGLQRAGGRAVGLSGKDDRTILARKMVHPLGDLGFVGDIVKINPELIHQLVAGRFIPVVCSIGVDDEGVSYNLNADHLAGRLAADLGALKLVMLTDVRGLLEDPRDETTLIGRLTAKDAQRLLDEQRVDGGMIPKLEGCLTACRGGVPRVHVIDGRFPHALLMELFTHGGIGTLIARGPADMPAG